MENVGQVPAELPFPDGLSGCLWHQQRDPHSVMFQQPLDEHQTYKRFAKANTVAEQSTLVLIGDFHESVVSLPLIGGKHPVHRRMIELPFPDR